MGICLSGSLARSFSRTLAGEAMAGLRTGGGQSTVTPYLGAGFWSPNKKSRIRETKHLLTNADSSTDTTVGTTQKPKFSLGRFFHRVAMSVCLFVSVSVCPLPMQFF